MSHFPNSVPISIVSFTPAVSFPILFFSSWSFLYLFFFNVLAASLRYYFWSTSCCLLYPSLVSHFPNSVPVTSIVSFPPIVTIPIFLFTVPSLLHFQFLHELVSYFQNSVPLLFHSCHVHQLSNSQSPSCLFFCFSFSNFHRSVPLSPNFRTISHRSAFSSKYSLPRIPLSRTKNYSKRKCK